MELRKRKSLDDFPHFTVSDLRRGATSDTGYTRFELEGRFDRAVEKISPYDGSFSEPTLKPRTMQRTIYQSSMVAK
jgi:hypothetical protein